MCIDYWLIWRQWWPIGCAVHGGYMIDVRQLPPLGFWWMVGICQHQKLRLWTGQCGCWNMAVTCAVAGLLVDLVRQALPEPSRWSESNGWRGPCLGIPWTNETQQLFDDPTIFDVPSDIGTIPYQYDVCFWIWRRSCKATVTKYEPLVALVTVALSNCCHSYLIRPIMFHLLTVSNHYQLSYWLLLIIIKYHQVL